MKVSFVATVFNEEKTIDNLLDSLCKQTKKPDEVIIVDGGSTDRTVAKIQNSKFKNQKKHLLDKKVKSKLKIFIEPEATIAQGRNYGVEKASGNIIVMSDAGCVLHKDWVEKITKPFVKEKADIVAGFYRMTGSSSIQKALAGYLGILPERFDHKKFLPSARSIAFRKSLWQKIGGFDERLDRAGEDTLFNYKAVQFCAKFVRVRSALVDWQTPTSIWQGFRKIFIYAKGDIETGIWWHPMQRISTHNLKIFSIFIRYIVAIALIVFSFQYEFVIYLLIVVVLTYLIWPIWKMRDIVSDVKTRLWLPVVQVGSDIAVLLGLGWVILKRG